MGNTPKVGRGYKLVSYKDETSQFDPKGIWQGGSDCYMREFTVRVPARLKPENFDAWLDKHMEDDIWVD